MIRVYRYGLIKAPSENASLVRAQMRAAIVYRNRLVELERERRDKIRALSSAHGDIATAEIEAKEASAKEEAAVEEIRALKAKGRTRSVPQHLRDQLAILRVRRRDAVKKFNEMRKEAKADAELQAKFDQINAEHNEKMREARANCGVFWGTYLLIEDAMQAVRKMPLYDGTEPNNPRFVRALSPLPKDAPQEGPALVEYLAHRPERTNTEGTIGIQCQNGLPVRDAFGDDTRFQIRQLPLPEGVSQRHKPRAEVRLRVGSNPDRSPIWTTFIVVLHRPLPPDAIIKRVNVQLQRIGPRERWYLDIILDIPGEVVSRHGKGAVAIDLGWRLMPSQTEDPSKRDMRVLVYQGQDGNSGELRLSAHQLGGLTKPEELRLVRDRSFNAMKEYLSKWVSAGEDHPAWLREAIATIDQWRSIGRLVGLFYQWKEQRFEGDKEVFEKLDAWRYHDHHLWEWETSQRTKSIGRRTETYKVFAARLASMYETIVLEDIDLAQLARRPTLGLTSNDNETARHNRHLAAVGNLRLILQQAFKSRGGKVILVTTKDATMTCPDCGHVDTEAGSLARAHVMITCSVCGSKRDQDAGASQVRLSKFLSAESERVEKETQDKPSRWTTVKENVEKRNARKGVTEAKKPKVTRRSKKSATTPELT